MSHAFLVTVHVARSVSGVEMLNIQHHNRLTDLVLSGVDKSGVTCAQAWTAECA
jgi:hypothetical protein